jgi:acetyltransferase-like isoleucine patch superfamily enzyme
MEKFLSIRISNRVLHLLARFLPGARSVRPWLHRLRGVKVGEGVFIGDDVYLENEYPEAVEIKNGVAISVRAIILTHTHTHTHRRGSGRVVIEKDAFIGPNTVIATSGDRTLRIGEGAVIGAGVVVTRDVPAYVFVACAAATPVANVLLPLTRAEKIEDFVLGLVPLGRRSNSETPAAVAATPTTMPTRRG